MTDNQAQPPETKGTPFEQLNNLLIEAVSANKLSVNQLHEIVINVWCSLGEEEEDLNSLDLDRSKMSIKKGASLLDFLCRTVGSLDMSRKILTKHFTGAESTPFLSAHVSLQFKANPVPDGVNNNSFDPTEIEFLITTDKPNVELGQYSLDQWFKGINLAASWELLYEQTMHNKQSKQLRSLESSRSKGYNDYITQHLESEVPSQIKSFLESGHCIGCGDIRKNTADYSSDRYCSPKCKEKCDQFFRDWTRGQISGDPVYVAMNEVAKIYRDKYGSDRPCVDCNKNFERNKRNEVRCPECLKKFNEQKKGKSAVKNQRQEPLH